MFLHVFVGKIQRGGQTRSITYIKPKQYPDRSITVSQNPGNDVKNRFCTLASVAMETRPMELAK